MPKPFDLITIDEGIIMEYESWVHENAKESVFQARLLSLLRQNNWLAYHVYDKAVRDPTTKRLIMHAQRSDRGFPDTVMVDLESFTTYYAELKSRTGNPSQDQKRWLNALSYRNKCYLWKPRDWPQIVRFALRMPHDLQSTEWRAIPGVDLAGEETT